MREAPIILPVFTTNVPLDFPIEGTFAFNKKTDRQLEVTVRINEHQHFNMDFLNHDGYIMACCRWGHVLDFSENGYDRYEKIIKRHFQKKYPVISSLYGQHTDTAEDIHISTIGFEGNPKEWYISMRIYGEKFEDLLHGNPLMNVEFASAVGNLCMASVDVFREIMKSDAKQPKALLKELTGIDEIDREFDFANYLDARNPETGEMISTARKDGKFLGVEMPEVIEMPEEEDMHPVSYMLNDFIKSLDDKEFVVFCNGLYFEIKSKEGILLDVDFVSESDMNTFEEFLTKMGDDILDNELHFQTERTLLSAIAMTLGLKMLHPFMDYWYKKDRSKKALLAFEMDGYIKKLMWRDWHTDYLKARVKSLETARKVVDLLDAEIKETVDKLRKLMQGMKYNAFMQFHVEIGDLMKSKKKTLLKYELLRENWYENHENYVVLTFLGHNSHDEEKYQKCRKHAEEIVCLFYENLLNSKFVGIPAKRNYAAKIRKVIEEMMEEDWSNIQNGIE